MTSLLVLAQRTYALVCSAVTDRFGMIYLCLALIVTRLESSTLLLSCLVVAWSNTTTVMLSEWATTVNAQLIVEQASMMIQSHLSASSCTLFVVLCCLRTLKQPQRSQSTSVSWRKK